MLRTPHDSLVRAAPKCVIQRPSRPEPHSCACAADLEPTTSQEIHLTGLPVTIAMTPTQYQPQRYLVTTGNFHSVHERPILVEISTDN